ncbi:hypothetical protein AB0M45_23350 [Nocardia sp. NPDC051787]|uniref:hypothetical protein n=1 Tax=Nocardia sp. NPDC051787 TaxID=3155415 RepID=UPI00343D1570
MSTYEYRVHYRNGNGLEHQSQWIRASNPYRAMFLANQLLGRTDVNRIDFLDTAETKWIES